MDKLQERINDVAGSVIGVLTGLTFARQVLGDELLGQFLDKTPEKGPDLWLKFTEFRQGKPESFGFGHFILSVVVPKDAMQKPLS